MSAVEIKKGILSVGAQDKERKIFDSLIPLPDGTTYNSYIIQGSQKTALIDSVDSSKAEILFENLEGIEKIDYIISNHSEQDHSGVIPELLERYEEALIVTSEKGREMLENHLHIEEERFYLVNDGDELFLGDKTLQFVFTPWVHWPETISTYLKEDKILFSCDFFGSHFAGAMYDMEVEDLIASAKRYYAEIMMPFATMVKNNVLKVDKLEIDMIAPSHGPIYKNSKEIIEAYIEWSTGEPKNLVVVPYVSMHGSTQIAVDELVYELEQAEVEVHTFNLEEADIGELAMSLIDAKTVVVGTPTVLGEVHPQIYFALHLISMLKPKIKYASILNSYGWGGRSIEIIKNILNSPKIEFIEPVLFKGLPRDESIENVRALAEKIIEKHQAN